jgi:hypothetical protein
MEYGDALEAIIRKIVREELEASAPTITVAPPTQTLSEKEFCERVGISPRTAQRLRKRGRLPYYAPTPGRVRYTVEHVTEFLQSNERKRKRR